MTPLNSWAIFVWTDLALSLNMLLVTYYLLALSLADKGRLNLKVSSVKNERKQDDRMGEIEISILKTMFVN